MSQRQLTGSRLRARRLDLGIGQAVLAQTVGISGSYLNLIEHNRRRIGGKILNDLARVLRVDPAVLTDGAETGLIDSLRAAASADPAAGAELPRTEEFAGRFPGWAALVLAQQRRLATLHRQVQALTDRLAHDPQLATSLHEVLSAATSIRSTASILVGDEGLDADWQRRFSRNVYDDSQKLAEASRALVAYLDAPSEAGGGPLTPMEEVEAFLEAQGWHLADLEAGDEATFAKTFEAFFSTRNRSPAGAVLARIMADRYRADAQALPFDPFVSAATEAHWEPAALSARFAVPLATVMRRLALLPAGHGQPPMGLIRCDGAGALTLIRPVAGLSLPRGGAACPLWPLFSALGQPGRPIRRTVVLPGEPARRVLCYAVADPVGQAGFDAPQVIEGTMLMVADAPAVPLVDPVGISCRICPRDRCAARREPSILTGALT